MKSCECNQLDLTKNYKKSHENNELMPYDHLQGDGKHSNPFNLGLFYEDNNESSIDKELKGLNKNKEILKKAQFFKPVDRQEISQSLYQALAFPELAKGVKLPTEFQIPSYCFQQKTSFTVATNASGNALIEVHLGQFLDSTILNATQSNVFVNNNVALDGVTVQTAANYTPINPLVVNNGTFTSVRPGPQSVKLEYIGRLDIAAGDITAGVAYSNVGGNSGVLPDVNYSILSAIEDSSFARTVPITTSLKGIYVPQDFATLNFKSPTDTVNNGGISQRMFFLVLAGPPSQTILRVTLTMNWEALPSRQFSDLLSLDYNTFPVDFNGQVLYNYIIKNNLVITQSDSEFGKYSFIEQIKRY